MRRRSARVPGNTETEEIEIQEKHVVDKRTFDNTHDAAIYKGLLKRALEGVKAEKPSIKGQMALARNIADVWWWDELDRRAPESEADGVGGSVSQLLAG